MIDSWYPGIYSNEWIFIKYLWPQFSSVQFSCLVVSYSLRPHGLQHTRLPCPSPSPGVCSNSYALSQWCHPTISSSATPFSSCPQSFPESGSFPMSRLLTSGGQSIGAYWFDLLAVQGTLESLFQHHSSKASILQSPFFILKGMHLRSYTA